MRLSRRLVSGNRRVITQEPENSRSGSNAVFEGSPFEPGKRIVARPIAIVKFRRFKNLDVRVETSFKPANLGGIPAQRGIWNEEDGSCPVLFEPHVFLEPRSETRLNSLPYVASPTSIDANWVE